MLLNVNSAPERLFLCLPLLLQCMLGHELVRHARQHSAALRTPVLAQLSLCRGAVAAAVSYTPVRHSDSLAVHLCCSRQGATSFDWLLAHIHLFSLC